MFRLVYQQLAEGAQSRDTTDSIIMSASPIRASDSSLNISLGAQDNSKLALRDLQKSFEEYRAERTKTEKMLQSDLDVCSETPCSQCLWIDLIYLLLLTLQGLKFELIDYPISRVVFLRSR